MELQAEACITAFWRRPDRVTPRYSRSFLSERMKFDGKIDVATHCVLSSQLEKRQDCCCSHSAACNVGLRYCDTQLLVIQNFWYSHTPFLEVELKIRTHHASIIYDR